MESNEDKIILDLYGGTGAWSRPYKENGYDVRVITLPEHDVHEYEPPKENVYGVLAAPPCTHFSYARTTADTPRDLEGAMENVKAALNIIWQCRYREKLEFWALENPRGYLVDFLGEPPLEFDPKDYGDPYTKRTCLWGKFNEPTKDPVSLTDEQKEKMSTNSRKLPDLPDDYELPEDETKTSAKRAITPSGFAEAFYKANK